MSKQEHEGIFPIDHDNIIAVVNCGRGLKRDYARDAPRGVHRLFSENLDFAQVVMDRENTAGLPPSPTWGSRPSHFSESYYWHTTPSSKILVTLHQAKM